VVKGARAGEYMNNLRDLNVSPAYCPAQGGVADWRKAMGTEQRTGVVCVRCGKPIPLDQAGSVAEEFTVRCENCGHRAFYRIKDIKTLDGQR